MYFVRRKPTDCNIFWDEFVYIYTYICWIWLYITMFALKFQALRLPLLRGNEDDI